MAIFDAVRRLFRPSQQQAEPSNARGWIGVDLDGTLAHYDGWYGPAHIGPPIEPMVERVKGWLAQGIEVRIVTARASEPDYIPFVKQWLVAQGLPELDVTNQKDFSMLELWDDRCIPVVANVGVIRQVDQNYRCLPHLEKTQT